MLSGALAAALRCKEVDRIGLDSIGFGYGVERGRKERDLGVN